MKILLDTHIFLWALLNQGKLTKKVVEILETPENELFFSVASSWEIAIKWAKGNLILPFEPKIFVPQAISEVGLKTLPITNKDVLSVADLPPIHKDPFDRLLITQANLNNLSILSNDHIFSDYEVNLIECL
jgi:PIN domain nuclease of toxin-antitoxin system